MFKQLVQVAGVVTEFVGKLGNLVVGLGGDLIRREQLELHSICSHLGGGLYQSSGLLQVAVMVGAGFGDDEAGMARPNRGIGYLHGIHVFLVPSDIGFLADAAHYPFEALSVQ